MIVSSAIDPIHTLTITATSLCPDGLFLAALRTGPMRELRSAAVLADKKALLLHRKVRAPATGLSFCMMFYRYATH